MFIIYIPAASRLYVLSEINSVYLTILFLGRKLFLSFGTALQKFGYLYKDPGCHRIPLTQDTVGAATEPVLIVTEAIAACQVFFKRM